MFRYMFAALTWFLSSAVAAAGISGSHQQVIDFTRPEQAAKLATWSDPKKLGCNNDGFGWDGDKLSSRDGWIETEPLAIGTGWRPTHNAGIRIKLQTSYPQVVATGPHSKTFHTPSIYVRYSADWIHWSDWQPTNLDEDPRVPGLVVYTTRVGVPQRACQAYQAKYQEWSRRDDLAWASDEDEFCRWLVKKEPGFFVKERPFVGYVQFLLETSFKGSQRLSRFEADVSWDVSGIHQPAKVPDAEKRRGNQKGWNFRGGDTNPKTGKFTFPEFLPGSRIVIGKELLDEVNALPSKEEQIQFLIAALPPTKQGKQNISDRQVYAIRLLSLTDSDAVIAPLMDRFDVCHEGDGWPVVHAMARLGERTVEPLLKRMQDMASDRQKVTACNAAFIEIKRNQYPAFLAELKRRKDIKLTDEIYEWLLEHYELVKDNFDS